MTTIGENTRLGIEYAQAGQRLEALAHLRRAVLNEPINAEVWLWLAQVSPDIDEYRNCVYQALQLDPYHLTAQRMMQDIQAQRLPPPVTAANAAQELAKPHNRGRRLRRLLVFLLALILMLIGAWALYTASQNIDEDDLLEYLPFLEQSKSIQFAVGNESIVYGFRADVPDSWFITDTGSPSWRDARNRLQTEFPNAAGEPNLWRNFESDFGELEIEEGTGNVLGAVTIIETRSSRLKEVFPNIPHARLISIDALPNANECDTIREKLADEQSIATELDQFIRAEVVPYDNGGCGYYIAYRDRAPDETPLRFIRLSVPLYDNALAIWHISLPETLYKDRYAEQIDRLVNSLQFLEPSQALAE